MNECCNQRFTAYEKTFSSKVAAKDLKRFKKKGPDRSTRKLIESILLLESSNLKDKSLLDIGSGIGALGFGLIGNGLAAITCVDVATEYLRLAEQESVSRGFRDRFTFIAGDIVDQSDNLEAADIVTLDKAICCYEEFKSLISTSVSKSRDIYGIVIPRETWWVKTINGIGNVFRKLTCDKFRTFIHPIDEIKEVITNHGFKEVSTEKAREWLILVFKNDHG